MKKKRKPLSEAHKRSIAESLTGKPHSEERKNRRKGYKHSEETKLKMSESHKGKNLSDETRQRMSERKKKKYLIHNRNNDETFIVDDLIQFCKERNISYDPLQKSRVFDRHTRTGYKILKQINE